MPWMLASPWAPWLNAAGRMNYDMARDMLTTADAATAREIAEYLETQNCQRQSTQSKMLKAALAQATAESPLLPVLPVPSPAVCSPPAAPDSRRMAHGLMACRW